MILTHRIAERRWVSWTPPEPVLVATIVSASEGGSVPCWPLAAFRRDEIPALERIVTSLRAELVSAKGGSLGAAPASCYVVSARFLADVRAHANSSFDTSSANESEPKLTAIPPAAPEAPDAPT